LIEFIKQFALKRINRFSDYQFMKKQRALQFVLLRYNPSVFTHPAEKY